MSNITGTTSTFEAGPLDVMWHRWGHESLNRPFNRQAKWSNRNTEILQNVKAFDKLLFPQLGRFSIDEALVGTIFHFDDGGSEPGVAMLIISQRTTMVYMSSWVDISDHELPKIIREAVPKKAEDVKEGKVSMRFWSGSPRGCSTQTRFIDSHKWSKVEQNYPHAVRPSLDNLMNAGAPSAGGKLVLWHGEPGGGKTNAIQALAEEWKDWCTVDYIVDPENFFGDPNYMLEVMNYTPRPQWNDDIEEMERSPDADKWRLVIVEDAGSYLTKDAGSRTGQAFGRLLNLTDGLLGQGMKILILITTNEPLSTMHAALRRPGRCMANIEFSAFTSTEASQWLGRNVSREMILAELYAESGQAADVVKGEESTFATGQYL
ncbi:MAG: DUF5925 domain-containing protein [bacterium]